MKESGHWYQRDGTPSHFRPKKTGAGNRPTTLADARKEGLIPSVSGYLKLLSAPQLEDWKLNQVVAACYRNPPVADLTLEEYQRDMKALAFESVTAAADVGSLVHAAIEAEYKDEEWDPGQNVTMPSGIKAMLGDMVYPAIDLIKSLGLEVVESEFSVVNPEYGYAGTTDIAFKCSDGDRHGILDFKTKATKHGKEVEAYEQHAMQIAAYCAAYWGKGCDYPIGEHAVGYNVFISTTEVGRVCHVKYEAEELIEAWDSFKCLLPLWRRRNKYDPRG